MRPGSYFHPLNDFVRGVSGATEGALWPSFVDGARPEVRRRAFESALNIRYDYTGRRTMTQMTYDQLVGVVTGLPLADQRQKTIHLRDSEKHHPMPFELTFSDSISYPDSEGGILLYVVLSRAGLRATAEAVVDSGGSVCLFSREIGVSLGLDVEAGIPKRLDSLGGPIDSFGHEVTIETASLTFQSIVYFSKYPNLPRNWK